MAKRPTTKQFRTAIPSVRKIVDPIAQVRLRAPNKKWSDKFAVLVDSGAVVSVFTKSISDNLGLTLESGKPIELQTAGKGNVTVYIHKLDLQIGDETLERIHIGFQEKEKGTSLLGRIDVFDAFRINLSVRGLDTIFLRELSELPDRLGKDI